MKDDDFKRGDILKEFDEEYHYFHDNSPKFIQKLNKKQINRFGELDCRVYDNPIISSLHLTEGKYLVNEAEYATYPARTSINYICKSLNIPKEFLSVESNADGTEFINAILLNKQNTLNNVEKAMHLCGYYKAKEFYYKGDERLIYRKYEPKYIDEANDIVRDCKYLYHLSPLSYMEKIMNYGFVPKSNNGAFMYPDRCYFFMDTMNINDIKSWIPSFKKANKNYNKSKYVLYTIDVNKIRNNVIFYLDPNLKGGIYTMDNITPNTIANSEFC